MAKKCFDLNRLDEAILNYTRAIELDSDNALASFSLRQFEPSIADMQQTIALAPPNRSQFDESLATI